VVAPEAAIADFLLKTGAVPEAKNLEQINKETPDYLPARAFLMRIAALKAGRQPCDPGGEYPQQDPTNFDALLQDGASSSPRARATAAREFEFSTPITAGTRSCDTSSHAPICSSRGYQIRWKAARI
jgi:hypothetical protein